MIPRRDDLPGPLGTPADWRTLRPQLARQAEALLGSYRRQAQPEGLTLKQHRPYQPGDDPRRLEWAASARLAQPIVRELEDEHSYPVWTVLDTSLAMFWGSHAQRKIDVAAQITLALGLCVLRAEDRWGLAYGGKHLEFARPPRPSLSAWREGWLRLAGVRPPAAPGNLPHLLEGFRRQGHTRGLIIIVSDFPEGDWHRQVARLAQGHEVVALQLVDPLDRALPATGLTVLTDPESGHSALYDLDPIAVTRANHLMAQSRAEVAARCQAAGATYTAIHTDRPWLGPVKAALESRHRRAGSRSASR